MVNFCQKSNLFNRVRQAIMGRHAVNGDWEQKDLWCARGTASLLGSTSVALETTKPPDGRPEHGYKR
jgi:hypothetical protein